MWKATGWRRTAGCAPLSPAFPSGKPAWPVCPRFGSNGFSFNKHAAASLPNGDLLQVNCDGLDHEPELTVAFVTRIAAVDAPARPEQVGPAARLVSIITTRTDDLRGIWGTERSFDPGNKPIAWR